MSGGSFIDCPGCGRLVIYGQTCTCGQRTDMPAEPPLWFIAWACGCTDVWRYRPSGVPRCPCHPDTVLLGVREATPGVSTNLGHMCPEGAR